jgi:hypothetical protein
LVTWTMPGVVHWCFLPYVLGLALPGARLVAWTMRCRELVF